MHLFQSCCRKTGVSLYCYSNTKTSLIILEFSIPTLNFWLYHPSLLLRKLFIICKCYLFKTLFYWEVIDLFFGTQSSFNVLFTPFKKKENNFEGIRWHLWCLNHAKCFPSPGETQWKNQELKGMCTHTVSYIQWYLIWLIMNLEPTE